MRSLKVDFFRGVALIIIFIDHTYRNKLGGYTLRGFGVADAAEIFFFCSGFVSLLVYQRYIESRGLFHAQSKAVVRAGKIYLTHLLMLFIVIGLCIILKDVAGADEVIRTRRFNDLVYQPDQFPWSVLWLSYQPFLFTILPTYILLSLATPVFVFCVKKSAVVFLLLSFSLYLFVQSTHVNLYEEVYGRWIFNPFAYQFLFSLGIFFAYKKEYIGKFIKPNAVLVIGIIFLLLVFVVHKLVPFLFIHFNIVFHSLIPVNGLPYTGKVNEEPLRIFHFLVLAYVVIACLFWFKRGMPNIYRKLKILSKPIVYCGQHSLPIFAVGVVLSYAMSFVIAYFGENLLVWSCVNLGGITLLLISGVLLRNRAILRKKIQST